MTCINELRTKIKDCQLCPLHKDMPGTSPVPGIGSETSDIVVVGEALGEDESLLEEPFVGRCGKLLDKILDDAGIARSAIFITNTVKCRPTKKTSVKSKAGGQNKVGVSAGKPPRVSNRPPANEEIEKCKKWLWNELKIVQPRCILTLGKVPTYTLLKSQLKKSFKLGDIVGKEFKVDYIDSVIIPCYHPSYLMVHGKDKIDYTTKLLRKVQNTYA